MSDDLTTAYNLGYTCAKDMARDEIDRLRAENEELKASLSDEYDRGFNDCIKRVEELEKEQTERLKERMKPIKDALYPKIYK